MSGGAGPCVTAAAACTRVRASCVCLCLSAASGKLGGGAGGGQESHPPVGRRAEAVPDHQPPQQSHVLRLRQRPVGWENGPRLRAGPGQVEPEVVQVNLPRHAPSWRSGSDEASRPAVSHV